ncbi:MAG: hypothetical protein IPJ19_20520 [Planctomycetes bacterium]|nr:hypothetical protein [Planctomycetota bacterium]
MSGALRIEQGKLFVVFAYDVGLSIDLEAAQRAIHDLATLASIRHKGAAPDFFQFDPLPLRVTLPIPPIAIGGFTSTASAELVAYDFGGISVVYELPIAGGIEGQIELACTLERSAVFREDSRARVEHLMTFIEPAVTRANIEELTEEYRIFQVSRFESAPAAQTLHVEHAQELARLLRAEKDALSEQEVSEALLARVSFGPNDVALIDWNAALVYDSEPEDVLSVLEFTNLQLLELRYLDARLDRALDRSYGILGARRGWTQLRLSGHTRAELVRVAQFRIDGAILYEQVNNALKLIGDQYLARVYRATAGRYRLSEWNAGILRKLETLEDIYEKVHDHANEIRMEVLEWIIIVLIALELVLPWLRGG